MSEWSAVPEGAAEGAAGGEGAGAASDMASGAASLAPELRARLDGLFREGRELYTRFDAEVRRRDFHPFVPANYGLVLEALAGLRAPGLRFLEWGSATGVITIMADLLGFEAYGIELDRGLVGQARSLARRTGSAARFVSGSFLPPGYRWRDGEGDGRLGTIGEGPSGHLELGMPLRDFDVVFGYPWWGEEALMLDVMKVHGRADAAFLLHAQGEIRVYRGGTLSA